MKRISRVIAATTVLLAGLGIVDEARGKRIADLAWPRVITGLSRTSKRTADFIMVGLAVGPTGIAGLGFAAAYWSIARSVGYSLANGGMTFMSQRFGADDPAGMDLAFKQTLWLELVLAGVFTVVFIGAAEQLIAALGASPEAIFHGTMYLKVVAVGLLFEVSNQLSTRVLTSANDAWTPMVIRTSGALLNIALNAVFIFGLGLGALGAALGTVVVSILTAIVFWTAFLGGRLPYLGDFPFQVDTTRPFFDLGLSRQIVEVSAPLVGKLVASRGSNFLMLVIVAQFGTIIVAAYVASREIRTVMNAPGWGLSTAARSLVGQELGANDEEEAGAYGWDILRVTVVVYIVMAVLMVAFASQIAGLFAQDPLAIAATIPFVLVMAVSLVGLGVDNTVEGIISAGGDTRWPLYGRLLGLYVFMIPIAYLGTITPLGILALYLAITAETVVPALVTFYRFRTDRWKIISRRYRPSKSD